MIKSFRHKGLRKLFETGSRSGVEAAYADKITRILMRLDIAENPDEMNAPGFKLHPLKGALKGFWSVTVCANWRIIFRFSGADICDVDLIDYH
jgi:proteic killer suppression protein